MGFEFHKNKDKYFSWQYENARDYVIPFIQKEFKLKEGMKVMEIGCGEGGVLKAFWELGCECLGVELSPSRIEQARRLMPEEVASGRMDFLVSDIYDVKFEEYAGKWDLIVLKDAIEHIPEQEKIISYLKKFLTPNGRIYFGFPPWRMPFGGHQQTCKSKILRMWPWIHLYPKFFLINRVDEVGFFVFDFQSYLLTNSLESIDRNAGIHNFHQTLNSFLRFAK